MAKLVLPEISAVVKPVLFEISAVKMLISSEISAVGIFLLFLWQNLILWIYENLKGLYLTKKTFLEQTYLMCTICKYSPKSKKCLCGGKSWLEA